MLPRSLRPLILFLVVNLHIVTPQRMYIACITGLTRHQLLSEVRRANVLHIFFGRVWSNSGTSKKIYTDFWATVCKTVRPTLSERCLSVYRGPSFLRRSVRVGFYSSDSSSFDDLCIQADQNLFNKALRNPDHVLHRLLPPVAHTFHNYCLRPRAYDRSLPERLV